MEIMTFKSCGIQVRVDMRNVRKQLGIQNWDLDVPMVVENRSFKEYSNSCFHKHK